MVTLEHNLLTPVSFKNYIVYLKIIRCPQFQLSGVEDSISIETENSPEVTIFEKLFSMVGG